MYIFISCVHLEQGVKSWQLQSTRDALKALKTKGQLQLEDRHRMLPIN